MVVFTRSPFYDLRSTMGEPGNAIVVYACTCVCVYVCHEVSETRYGPTVGRTISFLVRLNGLLCLGVKDHAVSLYALSLLIWRPSNLAKIALYRYGLSISEKAVRDIKNNFTEQLFRTWIFELTNSRFSLNSSWWNRGTSSNSFVEIIDQSINQSTHIL